MRRIWIGVGLIAALCAFCATAAPSLAVTHKKTHTKPPKVLGKFVANYPSGKKINETNKVVDKGIGSVETLQLADGKLSIESCKKIKSSGGIDWERSDTIFELVSFTGCLGRSGEKEAVEERHLKIPNFRIGFEFHSNGFVETGGGEAASVHVNKTAVFIKAHKGSQCTIEVPAQTLPVKATKKPENEFEAATYETEEYPAKIKKFPAGFQEELDITTELKKVVANVKGTYCIRKPKYKNNTGEIDIELEEVKIKNGNLGFRDKAEVEAEEKAAREAAEKAEKAGKEESPEAEKEKAEAAEKAEKEKVEAEEQQEKEKAEKVEAEEKETQEKEQEQIEREEG